jgi:TonB family protein
MNADAGLRSATVTFCCLLSVITFAQAQGPTLPSAMPTDPAAFIAAAAPLNGLDGPGMKPWHIKVSYQTFDDQGKPGYTGTFEEWWAAPDKSKQVYTSAQFNQTTYVTDTGTYRSGDQYGPAVAESLVQQKLVSPMPGESESDGAALRRVKDSFSKAKLTCFEYTLDIKHQLGESPVGLFPLYCFDSQQPTLRFSGSFGLFNTVYEKVGSLDHRFIGIDLAISDKGKPFVNAHLIEGNLLSTLDESVFAPPAAATKLPEKGKIKLEGLLLAGHKISGSAPIYPSAAKSARIQGKVILSAVIGEDGHIHQLRVKSAPDTSLAISALAAVRDWTYRPYKLDGFPVEVDTTISVIYTLGG